MPPGSMTNLPRPDRVRALAAHLEAVRLIAKDILTSPGRASDGPMPGL
jgi:hypothetical protein